MLWPLLVRVLGVAAGRPPGFSGRHGDEVGPFSFSLDAAAHLVIVNGHHQLRTDGMMHGDDGSGLQFEFGDADAVLDEKNFFAAALEDGEAAVFLGMGRIPMGGSLAKFCRPAEARSRRYGKAGRKDFRKMWAKGPGTTLTSRVGQCEGGGIFALDRVDNLGGAEHDIDIVMTAPVHQSLGMWGNVDIEDADLIVGQNHLVVGFGGDFDFLRTLRGEKARQN